MNSKKNIKVTVMIPTYNQVDFIREAIGSAIMQTYPNLEILVGDDGSTDGTEKVILNIADPRIKYIRNPINLGRTENYRNLVCNHATGDYVVNLDGDDYYTDPNFISEAVRLIDAAPDVMIVAARAKWHHLGKSYVSDIPKTNYASGLEIMRGLPDPKFFFKHMATVYRRAEAVKIGFYSSNSNSSDWESLYRLALRGQVRYLDRIVGVWRIHNLNESSTVDYRKLMENLEIWPAIYKDAVEHGMTERSARLLCNKCIAYFVSTFAVRVSRKGNDALATFLKLVFAQYSSAAISLIASPKCLARLTLCFLGFYRKGKLVGA